jgi:Icc-related predicted phosphoesterase
MRIHLLSDLHLRFWKTPVPRVDADVVVLAGDTDERLHGIRWAKEAFGDTPVIYVLGNHEYYGGALFKTNHQIQQEAEGSTVHVLECGSVVLGGVRFLGCTLWTDLELYGDRYAGADAVLPVMMDFRKIRVYPGYRRAKPLDLAAIHRKSLQWLHEESARSSEPIVIVTHHAPSSQSVAEEFRGDPVNAAFVSHLDAQVEQLAPLLWVHGHTHRAFDYRIGQTRVICNPRGYPGEVTGFEAGLVVEV